MLRKRVARGPIFARCSVLQEVLEGQLEVDFHLAVRHGWIPIWPIRKERWEGHGSASSCLVSLIHDAAQFGPIDLLSVLHVTGHVWFASIEPGQCRVHLGVDGFLLKLIAGEEGVRGHRALHRIILITRIARMALLLLIISGWSFCV